MDTGTIEQTLTAADGGVATNFSNLGEISGGLQIGQISNYRVVGESQFYELNLDQLAAEEADNPPRAEELTNLLAENRLLILAGDLEDKTGCARHIAYRLHRRLATQDHRVSIRERCRGKDPQRIETAFHENHTTILVLTEISQSLIAGYDPAKLRHLLHERRGYAIVTTDCDRKQWEIADGTLEARLWQELSWDTYYGSGPLAGYLEKLFFASPLEIPEGLLSEEVEGELRVGGVPLARAVEKLKTPERIRAFVSSLVNGQTPPTPEGVANKLAELAGDAAAIRQWYLQFNDRDQLLVVGLVLLDGLPDDLLFAGLEILVETIWRETDPLFSQFDYRDLSRFASYFKQTPIDGGFLRIECGSRQRRMDILQVAWNHQRRRLLATLPALTEMVRVSASGSVVAGGEKVSSAGGEPGTVSAARLAAERALGRTKSGSMQLHQVLVESLSLIGLISIEVVEPYLLDLAAEPLESVQLLVARALAVWREAEKDKEFFSVLQRWWSEACDVGNPEARIARAGGASPDPWAAVRATLALTVGFAAQYDRENELAAELLGLLQVLVDDPHPRVREAVWKHALPRTVAWHMGHLDQVFLRPHVLLSADFVQAVAWGAAAACEMRPDECLPIVEAWWTEARSDPRHGNRRTILPREILLATVAKTFGNIRDSEERSVMSSEVLVEKLVSILTEEGHPFVRRHAFQAIEVQTQSNVELATRLLPRLLARVTFEDRPQMAALAVRSYLHQRQHLKGGDRKLELDGRSYAVWTDRPRPLTGIEIDLYGWLFDSSRPAAQQLATGCFAALAATSLEREERDLLRARSEKAAQNGIGVTVSASGPEVYGLNLFGHLAVIVATPGREEVRPLLRPLMAEVIVERRQQLALMAQRLRQTKLLGKGAATATTAKEPVRNRGAQEVERIELILERWGEVRNRSAQTLASYLRRAVLFYRWRWGMAAAVGLLLFGLARLYQQADQAVAEPLEMLADRVIPSPDVVEDFMAPLPPGRLAGEPARFPYVVACSRVDGRPDEQAAFLKGRPSRLPGPLAKASLVWFPPEDSDGRDGLRETNSITWLIPKPLVLGEFAAPLPPAQREDHQFMRGRKAALQLLGGTPREEARIWRANLLLTH